MKKLCRNAAYLI